MKTIGVSRLVSVIIPAYNAECFIADTLESVFAQTYTPIEVIVIDDGSTDTTAAIVRAKFPQARLFQKPNGGVSSARNLGIRMATGCFVAFLDADDLWLHDKLLKQVNLLSQHPDIAWCYCDCQYFRGDRRNVKYRLSMVANPYQGNILRPLFLENFISSPTPLIKREVFEHVGFFDERIHIAEDWDMWLRIARSYVVAYLPEHLALYRQYSQTSCVAETGNKKYLEANLCVLTVARERDSDKLSCLYAQAKSNVYFKIGLRLIRQGLKQKGRCAIGMALRLYPGKSFRYLAFLSTFLPQSVIEFLNRLRILLSQFWNRYNRQRNVTGIEETVNTA